ncbi:response regulator [Deinococcus radiopugnans]|uniref:DNA-binding NarL/FixJ family response regulator n=1 Tax=Deinococcus radiopugnans ATCC 19172 TaxID=585398 RepID=A0A5C4Y9S8_9DEIO|nr:response regulator transcription factor [Deinococcus radiopugnans]MBB6015984.1 DNA-binding NarL/FixJ family response regulator [Deinococcus radiopugnans ATCC 19172]TNM72328.1 response regulator transcription factor [Deinococcus radiopugnans ATCC 19172]
MIRVLLVDDQPLVRAGLRALLGAEPDLEIVGEAKNGPEALTWLEKQEADVVLLDIRMPGLSGVDVARRLSGRPSPRVILLTTFDDERDIAAGLAAGAQGFLLKDASGEEIAAAIRRVMKGERYIQPVVAQALEEILAYQGPLAAPPHEPLTPRELEVLALIARGMSNKRIASSLDISDNTVKVHVARILAKLGAADRLSALRIAFTHGLISGHL